MWKLGWVALVAVMMFAAGCGGDDGGARSAAGFGANEGDESLPSDVEDMVGDMVEEIMEGGDVEDVVEDAMESAEAMAEAFGGDGTGRVEIFDETIDFVSEICISSFGSFVIEGLGETSDGTPVWVSIDSSVESREQLLEFLDEEMVETLYGDAETIRSASVSVDFGRSELFGGAPDDQPEFTASIDYFVGEAELILEVSGSSVSGSGQARDLNYVVGEWDDRFPFTFQAGCS